MILALKNWLTAVLAAAMLVSVAEKLIPPGSVRKAASMTGGLLLLLVLLQPLARLRGTDFTVSLDEELQAVESRAAELEAERQTELAKLIAERTEAYILDKADALGVSTSAEVETRPGEGGLPVPWGAELSCARNEALSAYLEDELGIPKERQVFHGDG